MLNARKRQNSLTMPDTSIITTQYKSNHHNDIKTLCGAHKAYGKSARQITTLMLLISAIFTQAAGFGMFYYLDFYNLQALATNFNKF